MINLEEYNFLARHLLTDMNYGGQGTFHRFIKGDYYPNESEIKRGKNILKKLFKEVIKNDNPLKDRD